MTLTRTDVDTNLGVVYLNGIVENAAMKNRVANWRGKSRASATS